MSLAPAGGCAKTRGMIRVLFSLLLVPALYAAVPVPEAITADGIPPLSDELREDAGRFLEFRAAAFQGWHPKKREMLITTRFGETAQLHLLRAPGGARRQLTFRQEPVAGGGFRPKSGEFVVFAADVGGGENFQLYRFDPVSARTTLLTDGKSRNTGSAWSEDGKWLAFTSTARTGSDNDVWIMDPEKPAERRLVSESKGGGWAVADWSPDGSTLLLGEMISANESYLWLCEVKTGKRELLTPKTDKPVARDAAQFSKDGKEIFLTSDEGGEFKQLGRMSLAEKKFTPLTADIPWDVESFSLSPDGQIIAFVTNEDGASRLSYVAIYPVSGFPKSPALPAGVIGGVEWTEDGKEIGFTFSGARSPADAWSVEVATGKLSRWTESETGGPDAAECVEPELVKLKSFDGLTVSGFLYVPDEKKFPGKRPVLLNIHGGPEGQSRPIFQGRNNYYLNELGVALFYPNVRGSEGYGKTFLAMDNGFKREDSVKDIAAFLDHIAQHPRLDTARVAVMGGSYGGYMSLACSIRYADRLRCGIDIVGISNFLTFLNNTSGYRRDLRRVEYGDERDPKMAEHLKAISPTTHADKLTKPLLIVQGKNDPRVPVTEAVQMAKAVRATGNTVWYLEAADEGHGFAKKKNADYQFLATIQFLREHLLEKKD
jgi:dipeptidyl aminopeptidase/acylaminoacyl peptidase